MMDLIFHDYLYIVSLQSSTNILVCKAYSGFIHDRCTVLNSTALGHSNRAARRADY